MSPTHFPKPHYPNQDVPEEFEPGASPVEPDEGPVPARIPDDPEHDRVIDPGASRARLTLRTIRYGRLPDARKPQTHALHWAVGLALPHERAGGA